MHSNTDIVSFARIRNERKKNENKERTRRWEGNHWDEHGLQRRTDGGGVVNPAAGVRTDSSLMSWWDVDGTQTTRHEARATTLSGVPCLNTDWRCENGQSRTAALCRTRPINGRFDPPRRLAVMAAARLRTTLHDRDTSTRLCGSPATSLRMWLISPPDIYFTNLSTTPVARLYGVVVAAAAADDADALVAVVVYNRNHGPRSHWWTDIVVG